MATYRRPLIDKQHNTIHPITCTKAIYDDDGRTLDVLLYRLVVETTSTVISAQVNSATLRARVYSGPADVTNSFIGNNYIFKWTRISDDTNADEVWNNNPDHYGPGKNTLVIHEQDILHSATYVCGLYNND